MAINESKKGDPRMWARWEKSGATGTMDSYELTKARALGPLAIKAICEHYAGPAKSKSTIGFGEVVINEGLGWRVTRPLISVIINGHGHKLGAVVDIPREAQPISKFFPDR